MARGLSESMCKLARREPFKPCALDGGDRTFLTIPLLNYNILSNTELDLISPSIRTSTYSDINTKQSGTYLCPELALRRQSATLVSELFGRRTFSLLLGSIDDD
jgi:hypothetical protein